MVEELNEAMAPQRFFEVALPEIAKRNASTFANMTGRISMAVAPGGAWTIHLGNAAQPITPGADVDAELSLYFSAQAFSLLMEGLLDFDQAIQKRAIGYRGDVTLLEKLGYLLSAGNNADSIMTGQVPVNMKRI